MQASQPLALKDIHLPDGVSWWPPAPGYWLILFICITIIAFVFFIRHLKQRNRLKKAALEELALIKTHYQNNLDDKQIVMQLSALLRRTAISQFPRTDCASLTGKNWLSWLDKQFKNENSFSAGPGYLLTEFNYSNTTHANDVKELLSLTEQWIKQLPAINKSGVKAI